MKSILLVKKFLELVEMMSGLVNASFSLPEWQAVKMIFFAPCSTKAIPYSVSLRNEHRNSILMMRQYPDLGSAFDWSCCSGNLIQPI